MVEIDGAQGEGGGQIVRTAVALAAARGVPVRIVRIRARRRNPGLAPQHVAAVRAVAAVCGAEVTGNEAGSAALTFRPGALRGGDLEIDVGTAGATTLVLQALLPALVASGQAARVRIRGGTDVPGAPPADYLRLVLLPLLARLGVTAELTVWRRGYYPRGGGEIALVLPPCARPQPLHAVERGALRALHIDAHVARLPRAIAARMAQAAHAALAQPATVTLQEVAAAQAGGAGGAVLLRADFEHTVLGAARVAQRGVRAETLGAAAAAELLRDLAAQATLDVHAADQMLVFLALAGGRSTFRAAELSPHARTVIALLAQLAAARVAVAPLPGGVTVTVTPADAG
ncbi:MAG: RNA 3'-terminal phosphate cyclase [Burkholderiaceae bacterium]|nr:RNA 3'-terminal phosphate cyclase [Burkholderiaceae bacterium]